jgi:UDP-2,3-diacylglucosamine hydrolase
MRSTINLFPTDGKPRTIALLLANRNPMKAHTLFISDLHLQESEPHTVALFEQFLKQYVPQAEALYILGDFFEVWPGDDENSAFSQKIRQLLKNCIANGTPVNILPGNRDFLLGPRFAKETGCTILRDPTLIHLYNEPILLLHGDILCTQDRLHQFYRRIVQNPLVNRIATHILPLSLRHKIGRGLRMLSKRHTKRLDAIDMDVIKESVSQQFQLSGATIMVHGHTHRQKTDITTTDNRRCTRYVLGSWHETGNALMIGAEGNNTFITL